MTHPGKLIVMSARDLQPAPAAVERREPELTRLQGYLALWREGWDPAPRDERWMRVLAGIGTLLMHLFLLAVLIAMAIMQVPLPPARSDDGERIRIGIVDAAASAQGSRAGGGQPGAAGTPEPAPAARSADSAANLAASAGAQLAVSEPASSDEPQTLPEIRTPSVPERPGPTVVPPEIEVVQRQVAEPVVQTPQPVQVTVVEVPTTNHVLPPVNTIPRIEVPVAVVRPTETQVRAREVAVVIPPSMTSSQVRIDSPRPVLPANVPAVREREVSAPLAQAPIPQLPATVVATPRLPAAAMPAVRQREVKTPVMSTNATAAGNTPESAATAASATSVSSVAGSAPSHVDSASASTPARTTGSSAPGAQGRGSGLDRDNRWGQAPGSDGWSVTAHDDGGRQPGRSGSPDGLFDADGRVNLGEADRGNSAADNDRGGVPGSGRDRWNRDTFDRSGSWLRSPPNDYTPTSFEAYWIPNESLLAEWVRNGIKEISIPIPGTRTRLQCVISILQVGGGCSFRNPNRNDQPAVARPPPDIPFKPELQEDNGSVGASPAQR
ncbi:MAG: hypothetical protein LBL59_04725 [Xanthomonadaceae bacterium]|jgi:hypothetical protein|nr:hypothetical protein [Xanthomonadaceae bacterium]